MKTVVVHESWFGNTRRLAETIAERLAREGEVDLLTVDDPPPQLVDVDLLVVGAPTHVHGLSSATSRKGAIDQRKQPGEAGIGVRGWLRALPEGGGRRTAVFDTRVEKPVLLVGSAARGVAKRLERRGFELVVPPESFFVLDSPGPLKDGEVERAAVWAGRIAELVVREPAAAGA